MRPEPQAAASADALSRPAAAPAPSARAGLRSASGVSAAERERAATSDQRRGGAPQSAVERRGQRGDANEERKRERDRAIGADAAVAHDFELVGPRRAAAEAVGDVGDPVLVQPAGRDDERGRREAGAHERGQAELRRQREDERAGEPDGGARDRRRPGDAVDVERRVARGIAERRPGEKAQGVADVARGRGKAAGPVRAAHPARLPRPND